MRVLLDTHVVIWQLSGQRTLSAQALAAISDAEQVLISTIAFAEMGIKAATGKLVLGNVDPRTALSDGGAELLALEPSHGLAVAGLPLHHRDPFDRLMIAQASVERLAIVTADS